jgi:subtilisin family serine protease
MKFLFVILFSISSYAQETRIKIAVIDSGLDNSSGRFTSLLCQKGSESLVGGSPFTDKLGHGTNVAGLIAQNLDPKTHCLAIYKAYLPKGPRRLQMLLLYKALTDAILAKVSFINFSWSGMGPDKQELSIFNLAVAKHIKVAVAAGNGNVNLDKNCSEYPACYGQFLGQRYFHVIGSSARTKKHEYSNYGKVVTHKENGTEVGLPVMTGTSQSTAIHTGKWASGQVN